MAVQWARYKSLLMTAQHTWTMSFKRSIVAIRTCGFHKQKTVFNAWPIAKIDGWRHSTACAWTLAIKTNCCSGAVDNRWLACQFFLRTIRKKRVLNLKTRLAGQTHRINHRKAENPTKNEKTKKTRAIGKSSKIRRSECLEQKTESKFLFG